MIRTDGERGQHAQAQGEATRRHRYSHAEAGRHLGLHHATISRIAALGR